MSSGHIVSNLIKLKLRGRINANYPSRDHPSVYNRMSDFSISHLNINRTHSVDDILISPKTCARTYGRSPEKYVWTEFDYKFPIEYLSTVIYLKLALTLLTVNPDDQQQTVDQRYLLL